MSDVAYTDNGKPIKADVASWSLGDHETAPVPLEMLKDRKPLVLTGTWGLPLPAPTERNMVITIETIEAFGIEWWAERYTYRAMVEWHNPREADIRPLTKHVIEHAEWWRRAGFYVLRIAVMPHRWLAEHALRPWARWILRDELDRDDWDDEDDDEGFA